MSRSIYPEDALGSMIASPYAIGWIWPRRWISPAWIEHERRLPDGDAESAVDGLGVGPAKWLPLAEAVEGPRKAGDLKLLDPLPE